MAPVFAHGRLRLYLLKLLDEAPRHGYEVIRLLEERFQGLYAPSAGTVYPRLAKLEKEGLVTHTTEGGRKVYALTDTGRAELASRRAELDDLEQEIRESVSALAAEIREDVRGSASDLRREVREAARQARSTATGSGPEQFDRLKSEWKEQARQARQESRRAKEEARAARQQAKEAQAMAREEVLRVARRVQDELQQHLRRGDWQSGLLEHLSELTREVGRFGWGAEPAGPSGAAAGTDERQADAAADARAADVRRPEEAPGGAAGEACEHTAEQPADRTAGQLPDWAAEGQPGSGDPARDLERLLDRFRDDVRDAARDHGVTTEQLRETRRHLSTAAAHIGALLRTPRAR